MSDAFRLKAAWVIPVDRPPIENGVVEVENGQITAVRPALPHESRTNCADCGDAALVPGFVNAHTHLEFSLVKQPFEPARPFANWVRSLVAYRRRHLTPDSPLPSEALDTGLIETSSAGATLVGEIATSGWDDFVLHPAHSRVVAFCELIGLRPTTVETQLEIAEAWLARKDTVPTAPLLDNSDLGHSTLGRCRIAPTTQLTYGLSPHAPYTVAPELLAGAVELAKRFGAPVAMHLAETREELEFLENSRGELVEMLQSFNAWPEEGMPLGRRPLDILQVLANAPRALVVHGNYLADDELDFIAAQPKMSVVYCPRTHEFFGHEPHPWRQLLARGANVALGTDGRGSNPDLSLWNELLFLRQRFPDVAPSTLLELGTLAGARALGFEHDCGSLTVGKRADLIQVPLDDAESRRNPLEALFDRGREHRMVFQGEELG